MGHHTNIGDDMRRRWFRSSSHTYTKKRHVYRHVHSRHTNPFHTKSSLVLDSLHHRTHPSKQIRRKKNILGGRAARTPRSALRYTLAFRAPNLTSNHHLFHIASLARCRPQHRFLFVALSLYQFLNSLSFFVVLLAQRFFNRFFSIFLLPINIYFKYIFFS